MSSPRTYAQELAGLALQLPWTHDLSRISVAVYLKAGVWTTRISVEAGNVAYGLEHSWVTAAMGTPRETLELWERHLRTSGVLT